LVAVEVEVELAVAGAAALWDELLVDEPQAARARASASAASSVTGTFGMVGFLLSGRGFGRIT
jgi:hypothetical protein